MVENGGTYMVDLDHENDRLYLELTGMLDEETAHEAAEAAAEGGHDLGEGFQMINDISEFKPLSQAATDAIEKGKAGVAEAGVSAVVRVVGESVTGKMQFDRVGDEDQSYHVATAESREQAVEFLEEFRRRDD
jgi:hypothetical protein